MRRKNHSPISNKVEIQEPRKSASLFVYILGDTLTLNQVNGEVLESRKLPGNAFADTLAVSNAIKEWSALHNSVIKLGMPTVQS